jgi:16S rRNA G966 N2-methylase RsmD
LKKLFNRLQPALPSDSVLVDFGSGKGRVLLIAASFGFREARGIEFAQELCHIARTNWLAYKQKRRVATVCQVVEVDAVDYAIKPDENVFFLFNPFDNVILDRVLVNLQKSIEQRPRRVLICCYNCPYNAWSIGERGFQQALDMDLWGYTVRVYTN